MGTKGTVPDFPGKNSRESAYLPTIKANRTLSVVSVRDTVRDTKDRQMNSRGEEKL
jgi:hypothetical protein